MPDPVRGYNLGVSVAEVIRRKGGVALRVGFGEGSEKLAPSGGDHGLEPGAVVEIARRSDDPERAEVVRVVAAAGTALAGVYRIAFRAGLRVDYGEAVLEETAELVADPGIDDPTLVDLTGLPFITIDYESSKDLDQAMFIARVGDGYRVCYALADAAYYVRPGMALFDESIERAASYYLPGLTVPMLPAALSEGVVSLNEGVDRRALVFDMAIDAEGHVHKTTLVRARVHSRRKLTYDGVQAYHDGDPALAGHDFTETLDLLEVVGDLRIAHAEERDVVRYDRVNARLGLESPDAEHLTISAEPRNQVQLWNEQISLMCNIEGARFLTEGVDPSTGLVGLFRVHPPPEPGRLRELHRSIGDLVNELGLDDTWRWHRGANESLADYVDRLPDDGPGRRLACALQRQAMLMNHPSFFSTEPGPHHGIGAAAYSRFSSPMREVVGVVTKHMAFHQLAGTSPSSDGLDREVIERVVEMANRGKALQKQITKRANKLAMDQLFERDLELPRGERPKRPATVMGVSPSKVYVQLDDPPVDVKLYVDDLSARLGCELEAGGRFHLSGPKLSVRVGDAVQVVVDDYDGGRERWLLIPQE